MSRKGVTIIGELIAFVFLIGLGYFIGGLALFMDSFTADVTKLNFPVTDVARIMPLHQENLLASALEVTDAGMAYKRMLVAAVAQGTSTPLVDGRKTDLTALFNTIGTGTDSSKYILLLVFDPNGKIIFEGKRIGTVDWSIANQFKKARMYVPSPTGTGLIELYEVV
jgi:hypothetical protein